MLFGPIENENLINYLTKLSQKDQSTTNAIFKIADEINKLEEPTVSSRLLDSEKFDVAAIESISIDQSLEKDIQKVLITRKEVAKFYKISLPTLWRWEKKGSIPKAIRIGGSVKWRKSDILNDLSKRIK